MRSSYNSYGGGSDELAVASIICVFFNQRLFFPDRPSSGPVSAWWRQTKLCWQGLARLQSGSRTGQSLTVRVSWFYATPGHLSRLHCPASVWEMQDRYSQIGFVQQILGLKLVPRRNSTDRGNDTYLSDFSGGAMFGSRLATQRCGSSEHMRLKCHTVRGWISHGV